MMQMSEEVDIFIKLSKLVDKCLLQLKDHNLLHSQIIHLNHVFRMCLSQIQLSLKPFGMKYLEDLIGQLTLLQLKICEKSVASRE